MAWLLVNTRAPSKVRRKGALSMQGYPFHCFYRDKPNDLSKFPVFAYRSIRFPVFTGILRPSPR